MTQKTFEQEFNDGSKGWAGYLTFNNGAIFYVPCFPGNTKEFVLSRFKAFLRGETNPIKS